MLDPPVLEFPSSLISSRKGANILSSTQFFPRKVTQGKIHDHVFHHFLLYKCCATRWIGISKLIFEHPHSTVSFHIFVYFVSPHRVCEWVVAVCALPLRKFMADHFVLPLSPQPFGLRSSSRKQALLLLLCSTLPLPKPLAGGGVFHSFFCSRKTRIFNPSYKLESTPKLMINN